MLPEMDAPKRSLLSPCGIESRALLIGACAASVHSIILTSRQNVHIYTPYRTTVQETLSRARLHRPYRQSDMKRYADILL
jgi:hypothetical protein